MKNHYYKKIKIYIKTIISIIIIVFLFYYRQEKAWEQWFKPILNSETLNSAPIKSLNIQISNNTNNIVLDKPIAEIKWSIWSELNFFFINRNESIIEINPNIKVCKVFDVLCNKISIPSSRTTPKRQHYIGLTIFWLNNIDKYINLPQKVDYILNKLSILEDSNKSRWQYRAWSLSFAIKLIRNRAEYFEVLTHEIWHIIDINILKWFNESYNTNFDFWWQQIFKTDDPSITFYNISRASNTTQLQWSKSEDFVSWYAQENPFEDFAETLNRYLNHNEIFAFQASRNKKLEMKFLYMHQLFNKNFFTKRWKYDKNYLWNENRRPRDTTRFN